MSGNIPLCEKGSAISSTHYVVEKSKPGHLDRYWFGPHHAFGNTWGGLVDGMRYPTERDAQADAEAALGLQIPAANGEIRYRVIAVTQSQGFPGDTCTICQGSVAALEVQCDLWMFRCDTCGARYTTP